LVLSAPRQRKGADQENFVNEKGSESNPNLLHVHTHRVTKVPKRRRQFFSVKVTLCFAAILHSHNITQDTTATMDPVKRVEEIRGAILNQTQVENGFYKFAGRSPCWPAEIVKDWLYLGGQVHASNEEFVKESGCLHMLNCATSEARGVTEGVRYHELCAQDNMRYKLLSKHMEEAHAFLREAGSEPILVHCYAGMNRSAALVVSYLMVYGPNPPPSKGEEAKCNGELCMSFDEAVRYVLEKRPFALSNPNFVKQLAEFEVSWQKE